jgi:L-rhamnose-H+ transport protein
MSEWLGFFLIVVGGIFQGSFFLGLKYVDPWKWENIWLVYSFCGLILVPGGLAIATVPHLGHVMSLAPGNDLLHVFAYGAGWGIGSVLAGLGVDRLGMALGVSVILAISAALGTFVPFVINSPDLVLTRKGLLIIFAVVTLVFGVFLVAMGGKKREISQAPVTQTAQKGSLAVGLMICIFSGIFSSMMNFAFAFSQSITHAAAQLGASQFGSINTVWMIALIGGFIPNGVYAGYLMTCNKTWSAYGLPHTGRFWLIGAAMGLSWTGGLVFYGRGGTALGVLGPVIGYPVFLSCMVIVSNVWGFATGEWKYASALAKSYMVAGCVVLMFASAMLGIVNRM